MKQQANFNYIGSIELPEYVVALCSHQGDCEKDIIDCMGIDEVRVELDSIDKRDLATELAEYGAWDDDELKDHDENLKRILWIASNNISEDIHNSAGSAGLVL